jgi:hypothetical protein
MLKPWTVSFQSNGTWYEMTEAIYQRAKRKAGEDWNNAKIVAILKNLGYEFITDPKNGFVNIR